VIHIEFTLFVVMYTYRFQRSFDSREVYCIVAVHRDFFCMYCLKGEGFVVYFHRYFFDDMIFYSF